MSKSVTKFASVTLGALIAAATPAALGRSAPAAPIERTVYVTVTDGDGAPITDLTPADFVVKEGGKEREILKAAPAAVPMHLALAVEEVLTPDGATRMALFEFMKRLGNHAEIGLFTIGMRNTAVTDYTTNLDTLIGGLNKFMLNVGRDTHLAEGVLELADSFVSAKPARPVIVVVAVGGGQSGVDPKTVLDKIRQSGATLHVATLAGGNLNATPVGQLAEQSGREQVLGDGPKQAGGRRVQVTATAGMSKALQQIAGDLMAQYAITYALPDGVKMDRRFGISVKRQGVSLRAPSNIPDR